MTAIVLTKMMASATSRYCAHPAQTQTIVARSRNDLASIPTTESAMTDRKVVPNIVHWARIQTIVSGALWNG